MNEAWRNDAACKGYPADLWYGDDRAKADLIKGKRICASCPVATECANYAIANGERYGMWGGLSTRQRRRARRDVVVMRACDWCAQRFTVPVAPGTPRKFCSSRCYGNHNKAVQRERHREESGNGGERRAPMCPRCDLEPASKDSEWAPYCWTCGRALQRERLAALLDEVAS